MMLASSFELRVHPSGLLSTHPIETGWAIPAHLRASTRMHQRVARARQRVAGMPGGVIEQTGASARPSVVANWRAFNQPFEGVLPFMYTDAHDPPLVTTGMGNLVDPVGMALQLPWRNPDGSLADPGTIAAQWQAVKDGPPNSSVNAGYLTTIRLDDAGIQQAIETTMNEDINTLVNYYPTWDSLPADAQLAILSMAWAMGAGFPETFTQFTAAINSGQYAAAADLSDFKGVGVSNRIAANKFALNNAQIVADQGLDPSVLYWPNIANAALSASGSSGVWKKIAIVAAAMAATVGGIFVASRYGTGIVRAVGAVL